MHDLSQLARSLEQGQVEQATAETQKAIEAGVPTKTILDEGLIAGMTIVGEKFKAHEIFLPDVLLAAKAMYAGLGLLEPLMVDAGIPPRGRVILGTVRGDLHDIGKNLVGIMLRGAGFEVIDLGKDVAPERYVDEAERSGADVVGMSALLTTTMPVMKRVIELAKQRGVYGRTKFIVGGAPLSADYAQQIGAHAYGYDGLNAVECVRKFVGAR